MLVLSRKNGESIHLGDDIVITVCQVRGNRVRLAINAPKHVSIRRSELAARAPQSVSSDLCDEIELELEAVA